MTILYIFAGITAVNVLYYIILSNFKSSTPLQNTAQIPISVIIAAKNERENLQHFLPKILNQNYHKFEVVVVNDGSSDNTSAVLLHYQKSYSNLRVIKLLNSKGKKNAITQGISAAKHEHLLFTDADCYPTSNLWIATMAKHFSTERTIILGYGQYQKLSGFLNKLIRYETVITALQYFGLANLGLPYMGVGRNLGYTKTLFYKAEGFKTHQHILSGDDDLFISQMAHSNNTSLALNTNSFTISLSKESFLNWFQQKRRHVTTANHYKFLHQIILGGFFITSALFWVIALIAFSFSEFKIYVLLVFLLREIIQAFIIYRLTKLLKELDILWYLPVLEISLIGVQASLFIANIVSKPKTWL